MKKIRTSKGDILGFNIKAAVSRGKVYVTYDNTNKKKGAEKHLSKILSFSDEEKNKKNIQEITKQALAYVHGLTKAEKKTISSQVYDYLRLNPRYPIKEKNKIP